eukprot:124353_1
MSIKLMLYLPIFNISTFSLFILWILIMQQLCHTKLTNKTRLYRIIWLLAFSTLSIFDNGLLYLSMILNHLPLWRATYIVEAICLTIAFHIFCQCQLAIIQNRYYLVQKSPPEYIHTAIKILEILLISAVWVCYTLLILTQQLYFAEVCYILLITMVFIQCFITLIVFSKLFKRLSHTDQTSNSKIYVAKNAIKFSIFLCIIICIVCLMSIVISFWIFFSGGKASFDHRLVDSIFYSLFLLTIITALYLWIYKRVSCCVLRKGTVLDNRVCNDFMDFFCFCITRKVVTDSRKQFNDLTSDYSHADSNKIAVLLENSSKHTIMTGLIEKQSETRANSGLTDYKTSVQSTQ